MARVLGLHARAEMVRYYLRGCWPQREGGDSGEQATKWIRYYFVDTSPVFSMGWWLVLVLPRR